MQSLCQCRRMHERMHITNIGNQFVEINFNSHVKKEYMNERRKIKIIKANIYIYK